MSVCQFYGKINENRSHKIVILIYEEAIVNPVIYGQTAGSASFASRRIGLASRPHCRENTLWAVQEERAAAWNTKPQ